MRTARLLPVSPSMHCVGGSASSPGGGVPASGPGGGVSQHAMGQTPPPPRTEFLTRHASLRAVKMGFK